jgi:HEPN domain-containing protein
MKPLTLEWVEKAEEDFRVAVWIQREPVGSPNAIGFHCQQCVEKYLKALLMENGLPFGRTHDLDVLLDLAARQTASLEAFRHDLKFLSPFSVEARYPGISAEPADALEALRIATLFRKQVLAILGRNA